MAYTFAVVLNEAVVRVLAPVFESQTETLTEQAIQWLRLFPPGSQIIVYEDGRACMSIGPLSGTKWRPRPPRTWHIRHRFRRRNSWRTVSL